jgi:Protein of unknown function (DUF4038)
VTTRPERRRRPWLLGLVLVVALAAGATGLWALRRNEREGQAMRIPDDQPSGASTPLPTTAPREPAPEGPPFATSVSRDGRYFLDQHGKPLLLHGDSPWALMTQLSPEQARLWFADRQRQGFNCIDAMLRGIRDTGDNRPFSIQLGARRSLSTDNPYWARRVDRNVVYTYYPTYKAVLDARRRTPAIPAVMGEANYEGENNQEETPPTTDETLRRQVLWSLTSGAAGEFVGSDDWEFHDGWEERLSTPALTQITRLRALFSELDWWRLVPDTDSELVTGGRGTELTSDEPMDALENDYATAAPQ